MKEVSKELAVGLLKNPLMFFLYIVGIIGIICTIFKNKKRP